MSNRENSDSLGVLEGYRMIARAWGPGTTPRRAAYLAEKGVIRVTKPRDSRIVQTTIDRLREDRDAALGGGGG
jgi:hypothetical protein